MKKIYLTSICFGFLYIASAQQVIIRCHFKNQEGVSIKDAGAFIEQPTAPGVAGGRLPDREGLLSYLKLEPGATQADGTVQLTIDGRIPHYLYFTAPGMKTYRTFFPQTGKKNIRLDITLYDTAAQRNEAQSVILTDDTRINQWLRIAALTSLTAKTAVTEHILSASAYRRKFGTIEGFNFDLSAYYDTLLQAYHASDEKQLKNFILTNLAFLCIGNKYPVEEKYLRELMNEMPASDYLWFTAEGARAQKAIYLSLGKFEKNKDILLPFFESLVNNCPAMEMKATELFSLLTMAIDEDIPEAAGYYNTLITDYADTDPSKTAVERYAKPSKIIPGDLLPEFSVTNIDRANATINNQTIKGKITLIDFWATWCGPCIAQFGNLEKVYEKYKAKGFEIVSISLDAELAPVNNFRKKRFKMPWINGFAGEAAKTMREDFGLLAIPRMILVDANGKILTDKRTDLSDDALNQTLAAFFADK